MICYTLCSVCKLSDSCFWIQVSANLAKPLNKGRLAKQGIRGGFKIRKYGEATNKTGPPKKVNNKKSKAVLIKENAYPKKFGNKPSSFQSKGTKRKNGPPMARPIIIRDKKHGRRGSDNFKERPLKKSRGNRKYAWQSFRDFTCITLENFLFTYVISFYVHIPAKSEC